MASNLLKSSKDPQDLAHYYEFIEHNELGLACDALEEAATGRAVSSQFWLALRDAAKKMQLDDYVTRYERRAEKP